MPLVYQHNINEHTKLGLWHITEDENFFLHTVPLGREITHWHKRLQHLAGRYLLHELFPGFPYHLIQIADTRKPYLPGEEFHFSISHCGDYAAVIVSKENRVGIDIELHSARVINIKRKFLNEIELNTLDISDEKAVTLLWSAKEVVFKWYGLGEVDFREHIHLHKATGNESGIINATFTKGTQIDVNIDFRRFDDACLAWLVT